MNGKKAKLLRKQAKQLINKETDYETIEHKNSPKFYFDNNMKKQGFIPKTFKMINCTRKLYKTLKKQFKN